MKKTGRIFFTVWIGDFSQIFGDIAQYSVDKAFKLRLIAAGGQFNAFIDCRRYRHGLKKSQLAYAQP